ncbi:hypothetical protein ACIRU8_42920 [Streptomyces sp. NPDC101175]|uniref:hypothetical protein n=1 Tax=Streptomyces sp. NPDC101175 TaxID=3366123 RepID=UPI003837009D
MNELWIAVLPTIAAGTFGIVGTLAGRRQTTDEAAVEHEQWLRGQRQTAYLEALDAMDVALHEFGTLRREWGDLFEHAVAGGGGEEGFYVHVVNRLDSIGRALEKPLERARLLGPEEVDVHLQVASKAYAALNRYVTRQLDETTPDTGWTRWDGIHNTAREERAAVMVACQKKLQTPARPGRRIRLPRRRS